MQRYVSIFILLLFIIWILPLGVFIRPNQEQQACNGQRAICLCSHLIKSQHRGLRVVVTAASAPVKEASLSGASGFYLNVPSLNELKYSSDLLFLTSDSFLYSCLFKKRIEHIPNA